MQFDWYILGTILSGLSSAFFGCLVFFYNRSRTGVIFLAFSFSFSLWTLPYAIWLAQPDAVDALFWSRTLNLGAIFIPVFYIHWIVSFLKIEYQHRKILIIGYVATFLYVLSSFSSFFIEKVIPVAGFPFWPQAGVLYSSFLFTLLLPFFTYGIFLIGRAYILEKTDSELKAQSKYIFIGSIMSVIGGIANFPLMFGIPFIAPQLTLLTVFHPMFWAYGSMKHKMLNVKTISTEVLVFGLWIFILARTILFQRTIDQLVEGFLLLVTVVFGIFLIRSVNKEVEQREALVISNKELAIANTGQKSLIHVMNHQIKGYLGKNKHIFAELMTNDYGSIPESATPLLKEGFEQSVKGIDYVQNILRGASAANGVLPYDMKIIDLKQVAVSVINQEKHIAEEKGLSFESTVGEGDFVIIGDAIQLGEVFKNLITNAIKYNSPNGSIKIDLSRAKNTIIFSVRDTGVGVSEKDKQRLFTAGGMGENSIKINVEAAGFGLVFVKGVAQAHNGRAGYRLNDQGKGSTFFIELPVK